MSHSTQFFHKPCPGKSDSEKPYGQLGVGAPSSGQVDYTAPRTPLSASQCGFGTSHPFPSAFLSASRSYGSAGPASATHTILPQQWGVSRQKHWGFLCKIPVGADVAGLLSVQPGWPLEAEWAVCVPGGRALCLGSPAPPPGAFPGRGVDSCAIIEKLNSLVAEWSC